MNFARRTSSRRQFLAHGAKISGGLLSAAALYSPRLAEPAVRGKPEVKMHFGLTAYQWGKDWDIPALIANCTKAGVFGVELRTSASYAHGVEPDISAQRRQEVKKQFADSPVVLVGMASSERFDWPDAEKVAAAVEAAKAHVKLSRDVGSSGVRVLPNQFHKEVPRERTIAQIAAALNQVGAYAADYGQQVRLEAHGSAGELPGIRAIMEQVTQPCVRVKLNSDRRDNRVKGFEYNFNLVKAYLGKTLHVHDFKDPEFPNQLQVDLLLKMGWDGWFLLESSAKVPDRVAALREQRELWEKMVAKAMK